jgi:hypothetical protein
MVHPAAELIQDWPGAVEVVLLASRQTKKLALQRRPDRPSDRAFKQACAPRPDLLGEGDLGLGPNGAHLDEELAPDIARQEPVRTVVDALDCGRIREDGEHDLDVLREFGRRAGPPRAGPHQWLDLLGGAVPDGYVVPDFDQALCDCGSHPAEPGHADIHAVTLFSETKRLAQITRSVSGAMRCMWAMSA